MSSCLQYTFYVYISIFMLMSYCLPFPFSALYYVVVSFICITTTPSIFMFFFSFLLLLFFLPLTQIKRFLLNMQAIVSSPSHDFTLSLLHTVCVCVCVCVCVLVQIRSPNICVSTWSWMRAAFCVKPVYPHFVVISDRVQWRRASPSCPACLWVLLSSRPVQYVD